MIRPARSDKPALMFAHRSNAKHQTASLCFARGASLIFQSTSVTKPQVNDLPFTGAATKIEKVWLFFL
jgi:hypothetical protein